MEGLDVDYENPKELVQEIIVVAKRKSELSIAFGAPTRNLKGAT
jgi:hypothetical protein